MLASEIARALHGRRVGGTWMACCPAHDDREPSLSVTESRDGALLFYCHAGCDQRQVIEALRRRGLWPAGSRHATHRRHFKNRCVSIEPEVESSKRQAKALAIWQASGPAQGTLTEKYLASRGLHLSFSHGLRFHSSLWHYPSGDTWPAMLALVTRGTDGTPTGGIHRTFLARDGNGKAPVTPAKMMLGPCRGGVVRLGSPSDVLMVGEGIETCLSAMQATGHAAWAALSTSGLRTLDLPAAIRDVIVLADGDEPGEAAAQDCARRWKREGRRVRIARPPNRHGLQRSSHGARAVHRGGRVMSLDPFESEDPINDAINDAEEIRDPLDGLVESNCRQSGRALHA